jgi:uncharacterized protein with von Willebrand factor type A (vWA) domain
MEERIAAFISALRTAGLRISIAESEDAFRATERLGLRERQVFQDALRTTLVKDSHDRPTFDRMFPLYFGSGGPLLQDLAQDLRPEEQDMLARALRALLQQMRQQSQRSREGQRGRQAGRQGRQNGQTNAQQEMLNALVQLLQRLLHGLNPTSQQLDQMAQQTGMPSSTEPGQQRRKQERVMSQMGMDMLEQVMELLAKLLAGMGMSEEAIKQLMEGMEANRKNLSEQVAQYLGSSAAREQADAHPNQRQDLSELMHRPFQQLTEREADLLRDEVRKLAALLRSKAALRRKKGTRGTLDAKRMLRTNLRYGGVPMELLFRQRHLKPRLLLICDISTSMRSVVDFLLRLLHELQDQVSSANSFAFISDLEDISGDLHANPPDVAIRSILNRLPPGHYNTDLGFSLNTLMSEYAGTIDSRTTVILVGDARNNYNDPRLDLMEQIQRRSRRIVWLNPEHPDLWGTGDSDMPAYLPYTQAVHQVSTLAELTDAVDKLLSNG